MSSVSLMLATLRHMRKEQPGHAGPVQSTIMRRGNSIADDVITARLYCLMTP